MSFRFPVAEPEAAPKPRPCLVLDIEAIMGERFALIAYGTTSTKQANRGYEIAVSAPTECKAAGLHKPTRFVGARRLMVPLRHDGFVICALTGAPILGHLTGPAAERMNEVRARIHAERDIAADRRQERRRGLRRAPRPFVVEQRRPRRIGAARPGGTR